MGRGDLTDEQWVVPEPLSPKGARAGRPPVWPRRQLIDGIRFRVRTGVPWRDVPVEYGPWNRIYDSFRRWQWNGTWQRILTQLQSLADARGEIVWDLSIDSTVCRAHQHAAGAHKRGDLQKEPPGGVVHRAWRSRPGKVSRRVHHQVAPGGRAGSEAHVGRGDGRAARRLASVPARSGAGPCAPPRAEPAACPPRSRAR